jgi:hypothetical protein
LAAGVVGKHTQPFVPARNWVGFPPSVAGQSIIVAALAMESGAALIAFLILSSLLPGATEAFCDAVVEVVVDAATAVSLAGAAPLLHASRPGSEMTNATGRRMRMNPSDRAETT